MHHADNFVDKVGTHAVFDAMDALAGTYDDDGNTPVKNPAGFVRWYIETDSEAQS